MIVLCLGSNCPKRNYCENHYGKLINRFSGFSLIDLSVENKDKRVYASQM